MNSAGVIRQRPEEKYLNANQLMIRLKGVVL